VDGKSEVITATETTAGDVNEAHEMIPLLESHHLNTGIKADTVVGDSKYGRSRTFWLVMIGGRGYMPDLRETSLKRTEKQKIFGKSGLSMIRRATPIDVRQGIG